MQAQGSQINAKADTRFLALSGNLATDLSQYEDNLNAVAGGGYELLSARTELASQWEVYTRCVLEKDENDKVLIAVHSPDFSASTFAIRTNSSGEITATSGSPPADVWTGPGAPAGDCSIAWSMRDNPDSTGVNNAKISEVVIYDHTAGQYVAMEQFTHAEPPASSSHTFSVGGVWNAGGAAMINQPATAPTEARVSLTFHPHVEFAEDRIAARPSHSTELLELLEPLGAGMPTAGQGQWVGQANIGFVAAHAQALRGRMLSPMVNEVYRQPREVTHAFEPAQWWMPAPGSSLYKIDATTLRWLSCDGWTHARVRVHFGIEDTEGDDVAPVGVRLYAMNRPHLGLGLQLGGQPIPPLEVEHVGEVIVDELVLGEWVDLGVVRLPAMKHQIEGWAGTVVLGLAFAIDPNGASGRDEFALAKLRGWQVLPVVGGEG